MATKELAVVKQIGPLVQEAKDIKIASPKQMESAVEFLSKLNKTLDAVTKEKEKVTKPANEILKAERARFKPYETQLEEAIRIVRMEVSTYQTEQKRIKAENDAKIAARVGEGKGHLQPETAVRQMEQVQAPAESVSTDQGTVKFRTDKKFEVMDVTMLPKEFILPNEVAIRAAMKAGRELPGVRYWEEETPINFR